LHRVIPTPPSQSPDLLEPNQLRAAILAHAIARPDYLQLLQQLLSSCPEAADVHLRDPAAYGLIGGAAAIVSGAVGGGAEPACRTVTFAEVAEAARLHGETAIG
jgi:hypothetical protein